jgi:cysteine sulfinate desulfinase/cysteine desulfurase-like protein
MAALYGESDDHATIRFSFGRSTTEQDIQHAADVTVRVVEGLKSLQGAA